MSGLELRGVEVDGLPCPLTLAVAAQEVAAVVVVEPEPAQLLADVVVGLTKPRAGHVEVDGRPVFRRAGEAGPPLVSLVPPGGGLLPHLTVADNIGYGGRVADGRSRSDLAEQVKGIANDVGVYDALSLYPHQLSPGRRLLVGLGRALLRRPKAVVIEDRTGYPPWAVQLGGRDVLAAQAVLMITYDAGRVPEGIDGRC